MSAAHNFNIVFKSEEEVFGIDYAWCSPITNPMGIELPAIQVTGMPGTLMTGTYDPDGDYVKVYIPQILDTIADKIRVGLLNSYSVETNRMIAGYNKNRHDYTNL